LSGNQHTELVRDLAISSEEREAKGAFFLRKGEMVPLASRTAISMEEDGRRIVPKRLFSGGLSAIAAISRLTEREG
jgi:hypothetical protein